MALANALLRVLSSHSSACSSSSSSLSSRKKKASIATKHSSSRLGRRVIASCSSSSSSSSSSSPESTNRSPRRRKKGREPLRAILEPCVLEPRSMDESDDNGETEKITKKTRKRTMTSKDPREDDNRSAATIVETDFLVRFRVRGAFTARLLEERCTTTTTKRRRRTLRRGRQNTVRSSLPVVVEEYTRTCLRGANLRLLLCVIVSLKRFFLSDLILPRRRRRRRKRRRLSVHFFSHSSRFHNSQMFSLCVSRNSSLCDR